MQYSWPNLRQFLAQKQELGVSAIQRIETSTDEYGIGYWIPYHFVIPRWILGENPRIPEQCLWLPPSLIADPTINDTASVSYQLRVTTKLSVRGQTERQTLTASEPVTVMSLAEELPPLEIRDFPAEFVESVSNPIRTSVIGKALGTMTISTWEPPALSYNMTASGGSTILTFQVDLDAAGNDETDRRLRALTFLVEGLLRMKTFRSTEPFPKLPSQGLLTSRGQIRLSDQVLKLETRTIANCAWNYRPSDDKIPPETPPSPTASASEPQTSNRVFTLLRSMSTGEPAMASQGKGTWRTNFDVPIHITSRLTPTFCSPLIARFYSLILRLKVLKAFSKQFELEVPVQVVYRPQTPRQLSFAHAQALPDMNAPQTVDDGGTYRNYVVGLL